jgi:drug/metabolite transporter (DMT)-like permease
MFNRKDHINFALQGLFMFCINYILNYWAEEMAPSALGALAFTSLIFFNMLGGRIFLNLKIEPKVFLGAFISFVGIGFITLNEFNSSSINPGSLTGFFICLVATLSASIGSLFSIQSRQRKIPVSSNNAWAMLYGSFLTFCFCWLRQKSFSVNPFDFSFIFSFIYLCIFGTIIAFGAYLKLIEIAGPSKAAFTSVVTPVIAVGISISFEKMPFTLYLLLGVLFCLTGNILALTSLEKFKLTLKKYAN